jgi:hypothetical protein
LNAINGIGVEHWVIKRDAFQPALSVRGEGGSNGFQIQYLSHGHL